MRTQEGGQEGAWAEGEWDGMSGKEKIAGKKEIKVKWENLCRKMRWRKSKSQLRKCVQHTKIIQVR